LKPLLFSVLLVTGVQGLLLQTQRQLQGRLKLQRRLLCSA
jgi:hypothetical protein